MALGELYLPLEIKGDSIWKTSTRWDESRELTKKSTHDIFVLYLVGSRGIGDEKPNWRVCELARRLGDFIKDRKSSRRGVGSNEWSSRVQHMRDGTSSNVPKVDEVR